jgi:hypothetical protein
VLLLAPRQDYPFEPAEVPDEVIQLRWQDTARIIGEWSTDDPVGRFLIAELTAYLREEDLVDPEHLKREHLVALDVHHEAVNALERVCELAATRVDSRWNGGDGPGQYGQPVRERWWTHPWVPATQSVDLDDAWGLAWQLIFDGSHLFRDRSASPVFSVGMTAEMPGSIDGLGPDRRHRLEAAGFELLPLGATTSRKNEYVWRVADLGDVLSAGPLAGQAALLADWVVTAFTDLTRALQPGR